MRLDKKEIFYILSAVVIDILIVALIYEKFAYIGTDGAVYATLGKNIAEGRGLTLYGVPHTIFSPLLPFVIAVFYWLTGNVEFSAHLATIFFGIAALSLVYVLAKEIASKKIALLALALFSLSGHLIINYVFVPSAQIAVIPFAILITMALCKISYLKEKITWKGYFWLTICGLAIGLSYLARPEYIALIVPVLFYLLIIYWRQLAPKKIVISLLVVFVSFAAVSFPYLFFLKKNVGYWTISGRTSELFLVNAGQKTDVVQGGIEQVNSTMISAAEMEGSGLWILFKNSKIFIEETTKKLLELQIAVLGFWSVLGVFFLALGVREFIIKKKFKELWIIAISFLPILALGLTRTEVKPSYIVQFFYLFIILIAAGLWLFAAEMSGLFGWVEIKRKIAVLVFTACVALFLLSPLLIQYIYAPDWDNPREFKMLGEWIKENISGIEKETVLARKPDVSFYTDANWQRVFEGVDVSNVVLIMGSNNYKYLVVDNRFMAMDRPGLVTLLNPDAAPPGLDFVKGVNFYDYKALLYSLDKNESN